MLAWREAQAVDEAHRRSIRIQQRVCSLEPFRRARSIALYYPFRGEVETSELLAKARLLGKKVAYPRMGDATMTLVGFPAGARFRPGRLGTLEPAGAETVDPLGIDCLIIPGVAFDRTGTRLGFGRGCYDRVLQGYGGDTVGLAFDFQIVPELPREPGDVRCRWVVSESETLAGC